MLTDEERKALVGNKVRRSRETWIEAKGIIESKYWHAAANRMYYACYYMVSALLLKNGQSSHTHGGTIGLLDYILSKLELFLRSWGNFTASFLNCGKQETMTIGKWLRKQSSCLWYLPLRSFLIHWRGYHRGWVFERSNR